MRPDTIYIRERCPYCAGRGYRVHRNDYRTDVATCQACRDGRWLPLRIHEATADGDMPARLVATVRGTVVAEFALAWLQRYPRASAAMIADHIHRDIQRNPDPQPKESTDETTHR